MRDDIRIPLHELQADIDYLFGRVATDGNCAPAMASSVKAKLAAIEAALARPVGEGRQSCECPRCGRNHWHLGTPPLSQADGKRGT